MAYLVTLERHRVRRTLAEIIWMVALPAAGIDVRVTAEDA